MMMMMMMMFLRSLPLDSHFSQAKVVGPGIISITRRRHRVRVRAGKILKDAISVKWSRLESQPAVAAAKDGEIKCYVSRCRQSSEEFVYFMAANGMNRHYNNLVYKFIIISPKYSRQG
jgi:hypothetical protein